MIFVDTSVWVSALGGTDERTGRILDGLLDDETVALAAPVRFELISGASRITLTSLRRALTALPVFYPVRDTWSLVESWIERAVVRGQRFGVMDLLIGAIATERGGQVWSLDDDFARMARLRFVQLYAPKSS